MLFHLVFQLVLSNLTMLRVNLFVSECNMWEASWKTPCLGILKIGCYGRTKHKGKGTRGRICHADSKKAVGITSLPLFDMALAQHQHQVIDIDHGAFA